MWVLDHQPVQNGVASPLHDQFTAQRSFLTRPGWAGGCSQDGLCPAKSDASAAVSHTQVNQIFSS